MLWGRGPRLRPSPSRPGRGRRGCRPGDRRSHSRGVVACALDGRRAATPGDRTHRAELLGSVLHAPGSGRGAGCSLVSPACAAAAPRLRSASPAPPRPPGPRPSPQPGPAQRRPRLASPRPSAEIWKSYSLPPAPAASSVGSKPGDLAPCVADA